MASSYPSANMGLPIPSVGIQSGPDYATNINASLTLVDSHDHSAGKGVQISPAGININSDFAMNSNNLITARSLRMVAQGAVLSLPTDLRCLYAVGVDLYFNDGSGNQIQITQSGGIAGTPGSIANLASPASASYVSANSTFVWQSAATTPANMDGAAYIFRNLTANSKGLTVSPPAAMASDYSITWPTLPASTRILSIDTSGNIAAGVSGTIVAADIATAAIITTKISDGNVTRPKLASVGQQISSSSGSFSTTSGSFVDVTNLTVTITTTGRPVMIVAVPDGSSAMRTELNRTAAVATGTAQILRGATPIASYQFNSQATGATQIVITAPMQLLMLDPVSAGTYTYKVQVSTSNSSTFFFQNVVLVAYEL